MKLAGQEVAVILTEDGKQVFRLASISFTETDETVLVSVAESEDLGLWLKIGRNGRVHYFLLRWQYILALDVLGESGKVVGLKG